MTLTRRGEIFSAFWYQFSFNKLRTGAFGIKGSFIDQLLQAGTSNAKSRFERDFTNPPPNSTITHHEWKTLNDTSSPCKSYPIELMNFTDNSEIEFVIDKFLNWLKNGFDNE